MKKKSKFMKLTFLLIAVICTITLIFILVQFFSQPIITKKQGMVSSKSTEPSRMPEPEDGKPISISGKDMD